MRYERVLEIKEAFEMAVVEVFFYARTNQRAVCLEQMRVMIAHFGCNFITNMNQLPEIRIIIRVSGDMTKGIGEFLATPRIHLFCRRKHVLLNVDHICIGSTKFFLP